MGSPLPGEIPAFETRDPSSSPPSTLQAKRQNRAQHAMWAAKILALVLLLLFHLCSRWHANKILPLNQRHIYPKSFACSLSLMGGHGWFYVDYRGKNPEAGAPLREFQELRRWSDGGAGIKSDAGAPLREFLELRRWSVSWAEYKAAEDAGLFTPASGSEPDGNPRYIELFSISRILDIRIASIVWYIFGINWKFYFAFYTVVSMLSSLALFLLGWKLGKSYAAGFLSALFYTLSPYEAEHGAWSIRDISPVWFFTFSLLAYFYLTRREDSLARKCGSYILVGVASVLTVGWRADGFLLPPFLLAAESLRFVLEKRPYREAFLLIALFSLGIVAGYGGLRALGPDSPDSSHAGMGFHMAYYGNSNRYNMLHVEDNFEIVRSDEQTMEHVNYLNQGRHYYPHDILVTNPEYPGLCKQLYLESFAYDCYNWVSGFPYELWTSLKTISMQGDVGPRSGLRLFGNSFIYAWLIDPINEALPFLFVLCVVAAFLFSAQWLEISILTGFVVYYGLIFFLVLPELKHIGAFLPPVCVVSGIGLALLARTAYRYRSLALPALRGRTRNLLKTTATIGLVWGLACLAAYFAALNTRDTYIQQIGALPVKNPLNRLLWSPNRIEYVENVKPPGEQNEESDRTGLLIRVRGGTDSSMLVCRHFIEFENNLKLSYMTRHRVEPGLEQRFFVTCLNGPIGVIHYCCTVESTQEGAFSDCQMLDMRNWKGLPFCLVYSDGQHIPGSPALGSTFASVEFFDPSNFDIHGVELKTKLLRLKPDTKGVLFPDASEGTGLKVLSAVSNATLVPNGLTLQLQTSETNNLYVAQSIPLTANVEGDYFFELEYKLQSGGIAFGALSSNSSSWVAQSTVPTSISEHLSLIFRIHLMPGDALIPTISNYNSDCKCVTRATLLKFSTYKIP